MAMEEYKVKKELKKLIDIILKNRGGSLKVEEISSIYDKIAPKFLYQYKSASYDSDNNRDLDAIKKNMLWYSFPKVLNDPFDSKIQFFPERDCIDINVNDKEELKDEYIEVIKAIERMEEKLHEINNITREYSLVSCFSETNESILMWSHYANSHRGICVAYDIKDINKINNLALPMLYSYMRPEEPKIDVKKVDVYYRSLLENMFTKSMDWKYEKEWRLLNPCKSYEKNQNGRLLDFVKPTSIYIGCSADEQLRKEVLKVGKEGNIDIYQMQVSNDMFALKAEPIHEKITVF